MASQKISQLTAITTVASGDYFPIVRASGVTNQRVEVGVLDARYTLAASGVAAQSTANTALSSGIAAQSTGNTALASGNAALVDLSSAAKLNVIQTFTAVQTLTDPALIGAIKEDIYTISDGAAFEIDPGNGSIQLITLGASRTPKATNFAAGESVTLMVDDGSAYTLTWTDATWGGSGVVWKTDSGSAPTLNTTGYTAIVLWKVGTQVYGARVGNA